MKYRVYDFERKNAIKNGMNTVKDVAGKIAIGVAVNVISKRAFKVVHM